MIDKHLVAQLLCIVYLFMLMISVFVVGYALFEWMIEASKNGPGGYYAYEEWIRRNR